MERVIGIDLGTTNCCVALVEGGRPRVVADEKGYNIQPSYIAVKSAGKYVVGLTAKAQAISNPYQTLYAVKRIIGRKFGTPEVEEVKKRVLYDVIDGPNHDILVRTGGVTMTPVEASAVLLRNLKGIAEKALGQEVTNAVITVPAYFNHAQRKATIEAGEKAGLKVLRLLNEPTAAALAYGFKKDLAKKLLVFDLGGGTFDVSVLEVGNDVYEVIVTNGDSYLGGEDFDQAIVTHLADRFQQAHDIDLREDKTAMQRLKDGAERAKCELSFTDRTQILIPQIHGRTNLQMEINRATLEALVEPLVRRCMEIVKKTLAEADFKPKDIDEVLLVGGQPRMPRIQDEIKNLFGKPATKGVHPDEAVAVGAAVHASALNEDTGSMLLLDVTPFGLGIDSAGDVFTKIVAKNATIPVSEKRTFTTVHDNQDTVKIVVRQGESRKASENNFLGEFVLTNIRKAPRMEPKIDVTFRIDSNGILNVSARDRVTGERQSLSIRDYPELASGGTRREVDGSPSEGGDAEVPAGVSVDAKKAAGGGLFKRLADKFRPKKGAPAVAADSAVMVEVPAEGEAESTPAEPGSTLPLSPQPREGVVTPVVVTEEVVAAPVMMAPPPASASPAPPPPSPVAVQPVEDEALGLDDDSDAFGFIPAPSPARATPAPVAAVTPAAPRVEEKPAVEDNPWLDENGGDLSDLEAALSDLQVSVLDLSSGPSGGYELADRGGDPFGLIEAESRSTDMTERVSTPQPGQGRVMDPTGLTPREGDPTGLTPREGDPTGLTSRASDPTGLTERGPTSASGPDQDDPFGLMDLSAIEDLVDLDHLPPPAPSPTAGGEEAFGLTPRPSDPFGLTEKGSAAPASGPAPSAQEELVFDFDMDDSFGIQPRDTTPPAGEPFAIQSKQNATDLDTLFAIQSKESADTSGEKFAIQSKENSPDPEDVFAIQSREVTHQQREGSGAGSPAVVDPAPSWSEISGFADRRKVEDPFVGFPPPAPDPFSQVSGLDVRDDLAALSDELDSFFDEPTPTSTPVVAYEDTSDIDDDHAPALVTRREAPDLAVSATADGEEEDREATGVDVAMEMFLSDIGDEKTDPTLLSSQVEDMGSGDDENTDGEGDFTTSIRMAIEEGGESTPPSGIHRAPPPPVDNDGDDLDSISVKVITDHLPPRKPVADPFTPAPRARVVEEVSDIDSALESAFAVTEGDADPFGMAPLATMGGGHNQKVPYRRSHADDETTQGTNTGSAPLDQLDSFLAEISATTQPTSPVRSGARTTAVDQAPEDADAMVADIFSGINGENTSSVKSPRVSSPVHNIPAPRKPAQLKVSYKQVDLFVHEYSENLRKGGTFVKTTSPLDEGRQCVFEISVPGVAKPVHLEGIVTWSSKGRFHLESGQEMGMGIEYVFSDPAARRELEGLLKQLA